MVDNDSQEQENPLQKTVDRVKTLNLVSNAHQLTPPSRNENTGNEIYIIKALESSPRLQQIFLQVKGQMLDSNNNIIQVRDPIMNDNGAYKLMFELVNISGETEFATYSEEEIAPRVVLYMEQIYPRFTFWRDDYNLNPRDDDYIYSTLLSFIDSCFHKAKNGHFSNILKKTYSEDLLGRAIKDKDPNTRKTILQRMGVT